MTNPVLSFQDDVWVEIPGHDVDTVMLTSSLPSPNVPRTSLQVTVISFATYKEQQYYILYMYVVMMIMFPWQLVLYDTNNTHCCCINLPQPDKDLVVMMISPQGHSPPTS